MRDRYTGERWASFVHAARERARLTRAELAARARIGRATIYRWESGEQRPERAEVVARLAEATGVDLDEALAAAGLRPATEQPSRPTHQRPPLPPELATIARRLTDPGVPEAEKISIRAQLRLIAELHRVADGS